MHARIISSRINYHMVGFSLLGVLILIPFALVFADPLVPCDGVECQSCHVVQLVQNIVNWFFKVMVPICSLIVAFAGIKMVTSGGDMGAIKEARSMMTNVLIGFAIILTAWLIVDTVMKTFVNEALIGPAGSAENESSYGPWNMIKCVAPPGYTVTVPVTGGVGVVGGPSTATGCTGSCVTIPSGITIKATACSGGAACTVSDQIAGNLGTLDGKLDAAGVAWTVTEAYPPTVQHKNPCHANGTCIDASLASPTIPNIKTFMDASTASGLRPVYEGMDCGVRDTLRSQGYTAYCKSDSGYGHITGTHFSVYKGQ